MKTDVSEFASMHRELIHGYTLLRYSAFRLIANVNRWGMPPSAQPSHVYRPLRSIHAYIQSWWISEKGYWWKGNLVNTARYKFFITDWVPQQYTLRKDENTSKFPTSILALTSCGCCTLLALTVHKPEMMFPQSEVDEWLHSAERHLLMSLCHDL